MKTTMKALFVILFLAIQAYPQKYLEKEFKGGTTHVEVEILSLGCRNWIWHAA